MLNLNLKNKVKATLYITNQDQKIWPEGNLQLQGVTPIVLKENFIIL